VIIIETVGVGGRDGWRGATFCLLQLNAGDDLQAIKKGIVEIADLWSSTRPTSTSQATAVALSGAMRCTCCARPPQLVAAGHCPVGAAQGRHRRFLEQVENYRPA
jgi:hypothetical protein